MKKALTFFVFTFTIILVLKSPLARADTMKLMVFGDSLTAGYGLTFDKSYPAVLEKELKAKNYDIKVQGRGVSGDTSSGGELRLKWSLDKAKPDLFILELGANDMLRMIDPKITYNNLDKILNTVINEYKIPAMLIGIKTFINAGEEFKLAHEKIYTDLAEKYNIPLYPFFLEGVAGDFNYVLQDGLHPNEKGIKIMVEKSMPYIEKFINDNNTN